MITPIEIENKEFKKGIRGYNQDEVDEFLDIVKEDFEQLYRENLELKEKVRLFEAQIDKYEGIEETLKTNSRFLNSFSETLQQWNENIIRSQRIDLCL